jgi:predicted ArsR family transcriptional regulator
VEVRDELTEALRVLAVLDDPSRRGLYETIRTAASPLTREQAAAAVGISRKLAAFHLDKLVDAGLLVAEYDRAARRHSLGRTPKTYRASALELRVSIPQRRPEQLAEVLLEAIASARPGEPPHDAALRAGRDAGRRLGERVRADGRTGRLGAERALTITETVLSRRGYEPRRDAPGCVQLRNCPFRPLADLATELVCGINEQFMTGFLEGLQVRSVQAVLAPSPGRCCVELRAST